MPRNNIMAMNPKRPISCSTIAQGKKKRDLEVRTDEKDRDEVVADVEFHARVLECLEAAFVRRSFSESGRCTPSSRDSPLPSTMGATPIAAPTTMKSRMGR
jgi:hypothetical protein